MSLQKFIPMKKGNGKAGCPWMSRLNEQLITDLHGNAEALNNQFKSAFSETSMTTAQTKVYAQHFHIYRTAETLSLSRQVNGAVVRGFVHGSFWSGFKSPSRGNFHYGP